MKKPRILLYSHDTFGLGHLRRSLSIAWQISRDIPNAHQLLITGSMVAGAFDLPPKLDLIKLPALSKRSSGKYKARVLPLSLKQTLSWREQMILQAVMNFNPDLVLVDKVAAGVQGELLPALRYLKACCPETKIVLGMRDIEDSPDKTRAEWQQNNTTHLQEHMYDALFLYGERAVFDPVTAYGMSGLAAQKLVPCGYLRRAEAARSVEAVRRELNIGDQPLVLVTVGGGGDGYAIQKTYLDMLTAVSQPPTFHTLMVTGPLMAAGKRNALRKAAAKLPVTFMEFTADLGSYLSAADLIISMAGYNTVCEILSLGKRALLIPRVHTRAEQRIRAMMLAERGLAHLLLPGELSPERLERAMQAALRGSEPAVTLNMNGLAAISQAVHTLLQSEKSFQPQATVALKEVLA